MNAAELKAQLAELKSKQEQAIAELAKVTAQEREQQKAKAIADADRQATALVEEANKRAVAMVDEAKAGATALVAKATERARVMRERAAQGYSVNPSNPLPHARKGWQLPDGLIIPLGAGRPPALGFVRADGARLVELDAHGQAVA